MKSSWEQFDQWQQDADAIDPEEWIRQDWALDHFEQIQQIAKATCEVNNHGEIPCPACIRAAREFFTAATFKSKARA